MPQRPTPVRDRFLSKVDQSGDCWTWSASKMKNGYGRFGVSKGVIRFAHRVSHELFIGPIPSGSFVLHRCDNPSCVNPAHLFLGTHADNMIDMKRKGRSLRGARNPACKFSDDLAASVRAAQGTVASIAAKFGVSRSHAHQLRTGTRRAP